MKKRYMEPQMIVEDFTVSETIAAENCKYTPGNILLIVQMTQVERYAECAQINNMTGQEALDYQNFSELYNGEYDTNAPGGKPGVVGFNGDDADLIFTAYYHDHSQGSNVCNTDPFEHELVFGKNNIGSPCPQVDVGSGNDSQLLQNS